MDARVYLIAQTQANEFKIDEWLEDCFDQTKEMSDYRIMVESHFAKNESNGDMLAELAGRRCYRSFAPNLNPNVSKVRSSCATRPSTR